MESLNTCVAHNLRFFRKSLGFTQRRLASFARMSLSSVREIESGRRFPSAKSFDSLAAALGIKPCKLLFTKDQMELYDKHERIASYYHDLSISINTTLDELTAKYLQASGAI